MKKIVLIVFNVIVVCFVIFAIFVTTASNNHDHKIKEIKANFLKSNKSVKIVDVYPYHGTKTYYVIDYKNTEDEFIAILNYDGSIKETVLKSKLCTLDKEVKIGYENLKIVYEEIVKDNKKITYNYYDAYACTRINKIVLEK